MKQLRKQISKTDLQIIKLLDKRSKIAQKIGAFKNANGIPVYDPKREKVVLKAIRNKTPKLIEPEGLEQIFKQVIQACRQVQYKLPRPNRGKIQVSIIGTGLIGGSLAKALRYQFSDFSIMGFDTRKPKKSHLAFDSWARNIDEALKCKVILLALPIDKIEELAHKYFYKLKSGQIVIDTSSTKWEISNTIKLFLPEGVDFIAAHPLAGKARGGFANSDPDIFLNRIFTYFPYTKNKAAIHLALKLIKSIGALPVKVNPETHDKVLAFSSHLPQIISTALAYTLAQHFDYKSSLYGPGLMDMTRLAASQSSMWNPIFATNKKNIQISLTVFISALKLINSKLGAEEIHEIFKRANKFRDQLEENY